jgi:hypothetical protein
VGRGVRVGPGAAAAGWAGAAASVRSASETVMDRKKNRLSIENFRGFIRDAFPYEKNEDQLAFQAVETLRHKNYIFLT